MRCCFFALFCCICLFSTQAQSTDLLIQKTGPVTVSLGAPITYLITVSNSGVSVLNATFNDVFPNGVSSVTLLSCTSYGGAVCPLGSNYTINNISFSGTIPSLPHGASVEFIITMNAPNTVNGASSISNTATVDVPIGFTELNPSTNSSTWNTTLIKEVDLESNITSNYNGILGNCNNLPISIDFEVFWTNNGSSIDLNTSLLNSISLSNVINNGIGTASYTFSYDISNVTWSTNNINISLPSTSFNNFGGTIITGAGSSPALANLSGININEFKIGDTLFLNYNLNLEFATYSGCGIDITYDLSSVSNVGVGNGELTDTNGANNSSNVIIAGGDCNLSEPCLNIDIETEVISSSTVLDSCQYYPYSIDYEIYWTNNGLNNIDSNTLLSNSIALPNLVQLTNGNTTYDFTIEIENVIWTSSNPTMVLPTGTFPQFTIYSLPYNTPPAILLANANVVEFGVNDTVFLNYTVNIDTPLINGCGRSFSYDLSNVASFNLGLDYLIDTFSLNNADSEIAASGYCNIESNCSSTDIETIVSNSPTTTLGSCGEPTDVNYQIQWINYGPANDENTSLQNYLFMSNVNASGSGNTDYGFPFQIENIVWTSSDAGMNLPSPGFSETDDTLYLSNNSNFSTLNIAVIPVFGVGDTITLNYSLHIDSPLISGCGRSFTYNLGNGAFFTLGNNNLIEDNPNNNDFFVYNFGGEVSATDLAISESVNPAIINHLDTTEITVVFQNASDVFTNNASWNQILPTEFNIIQSSISCVTTAGTTSCSPVNYNAATNEISQNIPIMEANSTIEITFSGWVNSVNSTTVSLEANASINCYDCVPQTNFTQTTFQIDGLCDLAYGGEISIDASDCNGVEDGQAVILTFGPYVGTLQYFWADSMSNLLPGQNSDTASGLAPGLYYVTVIDNGVPGCSIQDSIYVACTDLNGPSILPDDTTTLEDEQVEIIILDNDSDSNGFIDTSSIDLDPNTIGIQDTMISTEGFWYVTNLGTVIFIPNENFDGTAQISYTVTDNDGNISNFTTITVEVIGLNDAPQIENDTVSTLINDSLSINVFENDNDNLDSLGGIDTSSLVILVEPENGVVFINSITGEVTYVPDSNFVGLDSFQYVLCDNGNPFPVLCDTALVYIIVNSGVQEIYANVDTFYSHLNEGIIIPPLINDSVFPNNFNSFSLDIITQANNGFVSSFVNVASFFYEPNLDFYGLDSFQYVICDDGFISICDTATVYIYILYFPEEPDCSLRFSEGISPNGDGLNDFWIIGNMICYPNHELSIFNRWGNTVFKTKDYQNDWRGQSNYDFSHGEDLAAGTYFYIFKTGKKKQKDFTGFIYLNK